MEGNADSSPSDHYLCGHCKRTIVFHEGRWRHEDSRATWCNRGSNYAEPMDSNDGSLPA